MAKTPLLNEVDVYAIKALAAGKATAGQQQRVLQFLFNLTGIRNEPKIFKTDRELVEDIGKRSIGWQIARIVELTGMTTERSSDNTNLTKKES